MSSVFERIFTFKIHCIILTLISNGVSCEKEKLIKFRPARQANLEEAVCPQKGTSEEGYCWQEEARPKSPSLRKFIPEGYDKYLPPFNSSNTPHNLYFSVKARDIQSIDERDMSITIEWYIRAFWKDDRILIPKNISDGFWLNIDPQLKHFIWLPSVVIDHSRRVSVITFLIEPKSLRLNKDGLIRYSTSVTTLTSCPMDFSAYPFDNQTCHFTLESYQYNSEQVSYHWLEDSVEMEEGIRSMQFDAEFIMQKQVNSSHQGRSYPRISVTVVLKRHITFHLMSNFCPSSIVVIISLLSFLVPSDQVPGRMVLCITTLLTLMSMFSSIRQESPRVSYVKAMDQWMIGCIMVVFLVLVEFTFVVYCNYKAKVSKECKVEPMIEIEDKHDRGWSLSNKIKNSTSANFQMMENILEKYSGIVLTILFILFNIFYWAFWLTHELY